MTNKIEFKPSNVHQGHYVFINGESADMVVNLFAYNTIDNYKNKKNLQTRQVALALQRD